MGIAANTVARTVAVTTNFKDLRAGSVRLLPQRVAVVGQGSSLSTYATTPRTVLSALEVGETYGFGSPVHLAALQLLPVNGDGIGTLPLTIYPLVDDGSGVVAAGDITPAGSATAAGLFRAVVNNIQSEEFTVAVADTVAVMVTAMTAAINATLNMPVIATDDTTDVGIVAKWDGASGNDIFLAVTGPDDIGVTFAFTQPTAGAVNPDVDDALNQVGNVWETLMLNCMEIADTASLTKYNTFGEGRWGALVAMPLVVFTGNLAVTPAAAIAVPDARPTDRINSQLVSPGSVDLPFVVAARELARIAVQANEKPPSDYGSLKATGLTPGADGEQWDKSERELAVTSGSSTIKVVDGVVSLSDIVTFFHPIGDDIPAFRFVVDIVKLQNSIFNVDSIFDTPEWDGAPLVPDDQPVSNRDARQPKAAVAAVAAMLDNLGLEAIISNPAAAKKSITAVIDSNNPKRLNIAYQIQLSGNANVIDIVQDFGFFFG